MLFLWELLFVKLINHIIKYIAEMSIFWFCWEFVYLRFWTSNERLKSRIIVDITFENDIDLIPNETPYDQIKNLNILCSLYLSLVLTQIMKKK